MKKWLFFTVIILSVSLLATLKQVSYINQKLKDATVNMKAYDAQLQDSKKETIAFKLTAKQLRHSNDSIFQELDKTRKELKIKEKNVQVVQYIGSSFSRIDTLILPDTIFKEPSFSMDTTIGDAWYKVSLVLKYPSSITVNPKFKSEKHVIVSSKKETVNSPKKFFLLRWFQKKHRVIHVNVIEKNPYVDSEQNRYVEIVE